MDGDTRNRLEGILHAQRTGPLPIKRGTKPLSPIERGATKEASSDHWENLEGKAADMRGTYWYFLRKPSTDLIDILSDLMKSMAESWDLIKEEEINKYGGSIDKIKKTTDMNKLFARFEDAFSLLMDKEWAEMNHQGRVVAYDKLFSSHTDLAEKGARHIARLMQKARIAFHDEKNKPL